MRRFVGFVAPLVFCFASQAASAQLLDALFGTPHLEFEWRYTSPDGEGASEIVTYDATTQKVFVTNAVTAAVDVLDATDGTPIGVIEVEGDVNSVAAHNGLVAIAIHSGTVGVAGKVLLVNADDLSVIAEADAGFLPDMVTFTPNGRYVLVANEGEPNGSYTIDPVGSISVIDVSDPANPVTTDVGFEAFNDDEVALKAAGVRIFGPGASVAQDLEPEYIAVSADSARAYVTCQENNAIAVVDLTSMQVLSINPLGYKNHSLRKNAFDASNRDDAINIQTWPTLGMYQPDSISTISFLGLTLVVSANEGDAREYEEGDFEFIEAERVNALDLDPTAFPNAEELQENENLGRLNVTTAMGDTDGDGDFDKLYSFGARSFSIWLCLPNGLTIQVYDSGDDFERITAAQIPELFNSNQENDPDSFDSRSDDKGPEPEALDTGTDLGQKLAFIGLERVGGVMVYGVTNPLKPTFYEYVREADDAGPEGITFVPRSESPFTEPVILVSHEVSGTTTLFRVKRVGGLLSFLLND